MADIISFHQLDKDYLQPSSTWPVRETDADKAALPTVGCSEQMKSIRISFCNEVQRNTVAIWSETTKNPDVSCGSFAHSLTRSQAHEKRSFCP